MHQRPTLIYKRIGYRDTLTNPVRCVVRNLLSLSEAALLGFTTRPSDATTPRRARSTRGIRPAKTFPS